MIGKKRLLAEALERSGMLGAALRARPHLPWRWLTVLTYHRVCDPRPDDPFDAGAVDATPAEFDWQIREISRHFDVIGMRELYAALDGEPLPRRACLVSFDDGYRECHETALPILRKHGVRAVFFIATHYMQARRLFWWERINLALRRSKRAGVRVDGPAGLQLELPLGGETAASVEQLLALVKRTRGLDLDALMEAIERGADTPLGAAEERALADRLLMTWDQVRALRAAGMDVESHSRTHRVLGTLDASQLDGELAGSRADLEAALDAPVGAIAYPVGYPILDEPAIVTSLARAGYRIGFTNRGGWNRLPFAHPYDVRRVPTERGRAQALFRASLSVPIFA